MERTELLERVNPKLKEYVEEKVFPEYAKNDGGHQLPHIEYVIRRVLLFSTQFQDLNLDMLYTMAAYHDVAHHIDKDRHEMLSAQLFREDEGMKEFFDDEQRRVIAEAIEDHRSTLCGEPRSIYGKILSSADRSIDLNMSLKRTHVYIQRHFSNFSIFEMVERSYHHIKGKYGKNGTAKVYVEDPEFEKNKKEVESILNNPSAFLTRYFEMNGLYPEPVTDKKEDTFLYTEKRYRRIREFHRRKYELKCYVEGIKLEHPFMIEISGMPGSGKSFVANQLKKFFESAGFKVWHYQGVYNFDCYLLQLAEAVEQDYDILLLEDGVTNWMIRDTLYLKKSLLTSEQYEQIIHLYASHVKQMIDVLVMLNVNFQKAFERTYSSDISLDKEREWSLKDMMMFEKITSEKRKLMEECAEKMVYLNTSERSMDSVVMGCTIEVLEAMKVKYAEKLKSLW